MHKLQTRITIVTYDRENRIKCSLQTIVSALIKSIF